MPEMMMRFESLLPHQWPELYRLMVSRAFPSVPPRYEDAVPFFAQARIHALMDGTTLMAAFVFGPLADGIAFLDVVCAPRMQGLWASRQTLRRLYQLAFDEMDLRAVWVEPHGSKALKACLQAGFQLPGDAAQALKAQPRVLVMTPHGVPRWHRKMDGLKIIEQKGKAHGKPVQEQTDVAGAAV